jgi:hypothetical protein
LPDDKIYYTGKGQYIMDFRQFKNLFWDVDLQGLDSELHAQFIIERVLEKGTTLAVKALLHHYSKKTIIRVIKQSRRISRRTARFWQAYFNIKGPIRCLQEQSTRPLSKLWE